MSRAESPKTETAWAEADTHIHTHETEDELMPQVDAHVHAHPHAHPHIHTHPYPHAHAHAHVHAHAHLPEEELVPQMHAHTHTHVTEEEPVLQADASTQGMEEPGPQPGVVDRVAAMPLISSTCNMVSAAYTSTKESHPNVKAVCDMAEKGIRTFTEAAVSGAQPILSKLEPQITSASEYAHRGLDRLQTVPILQQTSDKVLADTKDLVSTKMTEAREMFSNTVSSAKDTVATSVTEAVDLTMSMLSMGMNSVMGTRMGQMVTSRVDTMLGKSEDWVDNHLPLTDEELARLAASVEGCDPASVQQQRREQSYFVRLGSLSERLRQRACAHALGRLRGAGQGAQDALQQLAHALSLIESAKQSVDQKLGEGQEKLSQMWMNWKNMKTPNKKNSERDPDPAEPEQVESQALSMVRDLTGQLQGACAALGASLQGLPAQVKDQAQQARRHAEALHATFAHVRSFQDLSSSVLAQSRERVAEAREALAHTVESVAQNPPLMWLVGPFSPGITEKAPETKK
ncbi:perilipin-3 [Dipodomys spectabilis]|uniref:perilipin-3 n=1 Tax=Dipodomys spectabilis TaxID=105255 RepID=UPI001C539CAA|nr:perilipin-3 [Dipodomys spectabilis]